MLHAMIPYSDENKTDFLMRPCMEDVEMYQANGREPCFKSSVAHSCTLCVEL